MAPARAQTAGDAGLPARPQQPQAVLDEAIPSPENKSIWKRDTLLGDLGGVRTKLAQKGVSVRLTDIEGGLGNLSGGQRRIGVYEGLTRFGLRIETDKAFGWRGGGTFSASGLQIRGRGLSARALGNNILTASSIEAQPGTVLRTLWYQQGGDNSKFNVRAGQMLADLEFLTSDYAGLFTNSTFGWPALPTTDLPDGGPAYPFGALGVRFKAAPSKSWTLLGAVFNGDSANPGATRGRSTDSTGTAFRLGDGAFLIGEAQYTSSSKRHPGVYKIGGWNNSQRFSDPRRSSDGLLLSDPRSNGQPLLHRGNASFYLIADQLVHLRRGTKDQGLAAFVRVMGAPRNRNLISAYADAGLSYKGLLRGRARDTLGLAFALARFSRDATNADRDVIRAGTLRPIRRDENVVELTYQVVLAPWWQIQPSVSYSSHLSGTEDATPSGRRLGNALVMGVRTNIQF